MSSNTGDLQEANLVPGAFPSEDAVMENQHATTHSSQNDTLTSNRATGDAKLGEKAREFAQQQHDAHHVGEESNNAATSGIAGQSEKTREFLQQQSAAHNAGGATGNITTPAVQGQNQDEKARDFHEQQNAAHTKTDKYIPTSQQTSSQAGFGSGQNSDAWTDVTNPETLLRNADGAEAPATHSSLGQTSTTGQQPSSTTEGGIDLNAIGSNLATAATAFGIAAKDALFSAKEAAAPAASAAAEQAKNLAGYTQENAAPAASYVAGKAQDAAIYTKDSAASGLSSVSQQGGDMTTTSSRDTVPTSGALDTANSAANYAKDAALSAANTAQSYAPSVLGEPAGTGSTVRGIAAEVPLTVRESVNSSGQSPEAATNVQAVEDKSRMEKELLGQSQSQTTSSHSNETTKPQADLTSRVKGLSLEEQLMPDSLTPGVVKVLGTEHDRSFPLGVAEHSAPHDDSSWLSNTQPRPKTAGDKLAPQVAPGTGSRTGDAGAGLESSEDWRPTPPVKNGEQR